MFGGKIGIPELLLLLIIIGIAIAGSRMFAKPRNPGVRRGQLGKPTNHSVSYGDIFISYASADRPTAQILASTLSKEGWSVWWDRNIPVGKSFDQVIEEALTTAKCVIVLWSKTSVGSNWVKGGGCRSSKALYPNSSLD